MTPIDTFLVSYRTGAIVHGSMLQFDRRGQTLVWRHAFRCAHGCSEPPLDLHLCHPSQEAWGSSPSDFGHRERPQRPIRRAMSLTVPWTAAAPCLPARPRPHRPRKPLPLALSPPRTSRRRPPTSPTRTRPRLCRVWVDTPSRGRAPLRSAAPAPASVPTPPQLPLKSLPGWRRGGRAPHSTLHAAYKRCATPQGTPFALARSAAAAQPRRRQR